jgi:putative flippase GtrA
MLSLLRTKAASTRPLKSALANAAATLADFAAASLLFHALLLHSATATAAGCAVGAVTSFVLSRGWAFEATGAAALPQLARYSVVSLLTMVLNAGGVTLLLELGVSFPVAWAVARCVIFAAWSYPLQRDFVFVDTGSSRSGDHVAR